MKNPNRLYLVENNNIVKDDNNALISDIYKRKITINKVREKINHYKFSEERLFDDMFVFKNNFLEITVWLKSESNFYCDEQTTIKDIDIYLTLTDIIIIDVLKNVDKDHLKPIEDLMRKFHLGVYHPGIKKHCKNLSELIELLKNLNLYSENY